VGYATPLSGTSEVALGHLHVIVQPQNSGAPGNSDVIVVGAGLAGLSCGFELADAGFAPLVLESQPWTGGRTASWIDPDGMAVESGLHRVIGVYSAFPNLLRRAGIDPDAIIIWEDEVEFRPPSPAPSTVFSTSPLHRPLGTLVDAFRHTDYLPTAAKLSFAAFITAGLMDHQKGPALLDRKSVLEYAVEHNVHPAVISQLLEPLVAGIYFVSASQLSAYVFMALIAPYWPTMPKLRVGAFAGGMTEVMTDPLADAIRQRGGAVLTSSPVDALLFESGRVVGVRSGPTEHRARHVILASSIRSTQKLVRDCFNGSEWAAPLLCLPTMPAVTLQLELDEPSMAVDHTTFGVGTALACFSEQRRTTFRALDGRLSIILAPSDKFIGVAPEKILEIALEDADRLKLQVRGHIKRYRVVSHTDDFYSLAPGNDYLRPTQATPVPGLSLAGDFTRQPFVATMEGAVVSGQLAAEIAATALGGSLIQ
jgi:15-cis-phytoene desaturase